MTAEQDRRGRNRALRLQAAGGAALIVVLLLSFTQPSTAAQPNQLLNPAVDPVNGTTSTTMTFSVRFESAQGNAPTNVTAVVGNVVIPLTLSSGAAANGRYRGSAKLPEGTWQVLFQASAQGNDPSLDGPEVTIRPAATPTPKPTTQPTPRPTIAPTQRPPPPSSAPQTTAPTTPDPATNAPSDSPQASALPSSGETEVPGSAPATGTPQPSDGLPARDGTDGERQLVTILTGGLIAIGALALIGFFAVFRDRRRRKGEAQLAYLPEGAADVAAKPPPPARVPTKWERDFALDEEPIGTVEYRPPPVPDDEAT
ncbi:MAG TPA: hypothetical protein VFH90_03235 [Candidatus Limnocylindria bacterium]|nr:hypothetical protein [Candidatus Limnocylindria bacterium]